MTDLSLEIAGLPLSELVPAVRPPGGLGRPFVQEDASQCNR
jgi:hypothetical protein